MTDFPDFDVPDSSKLPSEKNPANYSSNVEWFITVFLPTLCSKLRQLCIALKERDWLINPTSLAGQPGGVATLNENRLVVQDPASKGLANGVAPLAENKCVPSKHLAQHIFHDCYFKYVSPTEARLFREKGKWLTLNDIPREIPEAGVPLAPTGSTSGTVYYVYADWAEEEMTLLSSVKAPVPDPRNGLLVMTDDATKTFVGMTRPILINSVVSFANSASQRLVVSEYNRKSLAAVSAEGLAFVISGPLSERTASNRAEFLCRGDEAVACTLSVKYHYVDAANQTTQAYIYLDTTPLAGFQVAQNNSSTPGANEVSKHILPVSGYHYATMYGTTGVNSTFLLNGIYVSFRG